jgi:type I restriction enzyme M protein
LFDWKDDYIEEHGGEDGLLAEAKNDKGNLTKANIKARLKEIKNDVDSDDERDQLDAYLSLIEQESIASKKVKDAQKLLDTQVAAQYVKLSEEEIKTLVVEDKWFTTLTADVHTELGRVSQALTGRIKELAERYAETLPQLVTDVAALNTKVDAHLTKMGFTWK